MSLMRPPASPLLLADSYLHTLSPFVIDGLPVRWYGLSYAIGFLLAWWIMRLIAQRGWSSLKPQATGDLIFAVVIGVLVGGRVGFALFYERTLFVQFSPLFPWWNLLAINKGGMSSHGGLIGVMIAVWWFGRKHGVSPLHIMDMGTLACLPGLFLGRIANFINAELWGKALPAAHQANPPWWSVKYPAQVFERWWPAARQGKLTDKEHADIIAAAAHDFHLVAPPQELELVVAKAAEAKIDQLEQVLGPTLTLDDRFLDRVVTIASEADHALHAQVAAALKPLLTAYYPSQLLQAISDGPALALLLIVLWLKPRKPGMIAACWLIGYGSFRIVTELFRQPDEGVAVIAGLQRGQLLSVLMILAGAIGLVMVARRQTPKIGGLFATSPGRGSASGSSNTSISTGALLPRATQRSYAFWPARLVTFSSRRNSMYSFEVVW